MLRARTWQAIVSAVVAASAVVAVFGGATARASSLSIVPCSGPGSGGAGLIAAINTANASGGGSIDSSLMQVRLDQSLFQELAQAQLECAPPGDYSDF